eukprot:scaffold397_cov111-Cylindrotheca_fusiformis.AAC.7
MFYFRLLLLQLATGVVSSWSYPNRIADKWKRLSATRPASAPSDESTSALEESVVFGKLHPLLLPGESVLGSMGVPTFASDGSSDIVDSVDLSKARGLEGVLNQGPSLVIDKVLTPKACEQIIHDCDQIGFGSYDSGKNHHGALQILVSQEMADGVAQRLSRHIDLEQVKAIRDEMIVGSGGQLVEEDVRLVFSGLNRRWRIYRYDSDGCQTFTPHIDAGFPPSGISDDDSTLLWDASDENGDEIVSRLTVLMYLNDDFVGGETNFYGSSSVYGDDDLSLIASVRPVQGSCLLFPQGVGEEAVEYARTHWPLHEGSPVRSGRPKYVIRSDVLFVTQREPLLLEDERFRNDHLVRQAFLPTSPTINQKFLGHAMSLYNPHMGVENLGPLLYSFIRFTKKRKIVEIGAGYTSLWIVQALAENDEELERIRALEQTDRCRLLNYPWTLPGALEEFEREPASLLCIDNCEHQKETATGASAVAKSLGLSSYMQFRKGDAFELELEPDSVDVLWCDFGVGSRQFSSCFHNHRMRDFVSSAWRSLRPGGFLLCHTTLTNENTRTWLEAVRARSEVEKTGIPPDDYVELSLLEPHKSFQNSISILQKRKSTDAGAYKEPIFSTFA